MTFEEYRDISLSIKNDIDFELFFSLCSGKNYTSEYIERIWKIFCDRPFEFILYHDIGKDLFNYLKAGKYLVGQFYLP